MAASFPSSVKSFTTKLAGDTIQASYVNDLQDEVTALETALVGGTLPAANGSALTNLNASNLSSGTVPDARVAATNLNASQLTSGTVAEARLGSGTGTVNKVLRGNNTWGDPPGITTDGASAIQQLVFAAAQSASAGANVLDDYEEGTWTPADGSGASLSITNSGAQYVKIGQLVIASAHIVYPATASGSNSNISGLPFTNQSVTCFGAFVAYSDYGSGIYALVGSAATSVSFYNLSGANLTNANLTGKQVRFTVVYRASA